MGQDFADWYAENTDADYDLVVKMVSLYLKKEYDRGYEQGVEDRYKMEWG